MPSKSINTKAIVLRKTKLSENDLIITLLCEDGSQVRAVAKGARKPSSIFASRLELFTNIKVHIIKRKNLGIITECKIINSNSVIRTNIYMYICASPVLELLEKSTQYGIINDDIYNMTIVFLNILTTIDSNKLMNCLLIAYLIKACSVLGYRPNFSSCVICSNKVDNNFNIPNLNLNFNFEDGGLICYKCSNKTETIKINLKTINLLKNLLHTKFSDIKIFDFDKSLCFDSIDFLQKWILYHMGFELKSLKFYKKNIQT